MSQNRKKHYKNGYPVTRLSKDTKHVKDLSNDFDAEILSEDFKNMCHTFSKQFSNHFTGERLLPNILNFEDSVTNYQEFYPSGGIKKILNNKSKNVHPFENYYNDIKSEITQKNTTNTKSKSNSSRSKDFKKSKETIINISQETHPYCYTNNQTSNNNKYNDISRESEPYISSDYFMPYDNIHACSIPVEIPINNDVFEKEYVSDSENKDVVINNTCPTYNSKDILIDVNEESYSISSLPMPIYYDSPNVIPIDIFDKNNEENNLESIQEKDIQEKDIQKKDIQPNIFLPALYYDSLKNAMSIDIIDKDIKENNLESIQEKDIQPNINEPINNIKIESDGFMININNVSGDENIKELNSNEEITDIEKKVDLINIDKDNYNINKNYINKDNMNKEYMNTENSLEESRSVTGMNLEESRFDLSDKNIKFKELSVSDVNVSLKVVGELKEGSKLKIVDNYYLAEDNDNNGYLGSFRRSMSGQSRDKIVVFLQHLFEETKRNHLQLLAEIRNDKDTANKMPELRDLFGNMIIFLHKYEVMRNVYKTDSGTYAKLGEIRNSFFRFRESFFKELCVPGSK
ncbi:hypothetical protein QJ854_gp613 [Moumouvirus goulette]|uniref:Uncharacterized protein n=1 Tax=Moumouvirus goulette TaxID=1247379 RepID=M1PB90_9VIRU|nr:hypothetical protein QJ854_gp613 [Moumouvirus goulette]AGF85169.1 hypothetical protein glt_00360 [Moumouvirus goulette]